MTSLDARITPLILVFLLGTSFLYGQTGGVNPSVERQHREVFAGFIDTPITLDGVLDELVWNQVEPATDFIQREPFEGQPATEKTEIRVLYDTEALYFGASVYDSEPDKLIINSLKQDYPITQSDGISFYLDTFNDDRNLYAFFINPAGAKHETQVEDEGKNQSLAWEDVWEVKTRITAAGWYAEVKIPFKSLRFSKAKIQTWGINFQRRIRRRNEQAFWGPMPRRFISFNMSFAGDLKGLKNIKPGRNFKVKPFVTSEFRGLSGDDFDIQGDVGLDIKYGLSPDLTLDGTLNTDFSQVEVDEQQINLTRFSLFFPEKRDFFLENAGIFSFGPTAQRDVSQDLILFFSRRIGLSTNGQPLPILGGARLTGRQGKYRLGLFNMQTRESNSDPSNNFTVLRIKRNILNNSDLGGMFINRDSSQPGDYNRTFGIDLNFRFWEDLSVTSFLAATRTPDLKKNDMAGRVWVEWKTNLWEARTGYLSIGENFNPEVGFVPRRNIQKSDTSIGWRPRPESISWIREFFPSVQFQYITDQEGDLVTRETGLTFKTNFNNGGSFEVGRTLSFERLDVPFRIYRDLKIAAGDYHFNHWSMQLSSNPSANISGRLRYGTGDFWNGTRKGMLLSLALKPHYKFSVSSQLQWTHLKLKGGDFTTRLFSTRIEYAFSTKRFLSALIQYNSDLDQISTNLRFNLIHRPLSDIFVVYTEQRDVSKTGALNKSLMFKYTHMLNVF
ncbi:MAG: DUF5916 domain-containing protein [Acidobacteriota bacterium]|nr:DUF5916 domain-containing protein [Acidobacteriota bacterium]